VLGVATAIAAQTPSPKAKPTTPSAAKAAKGWTVPRTPDGQPDLQGIWTNASLTPFDRPDQFAGKEFFTEEEAAEFARRVNDQSNRDRRGTTAEADVAGAYNEAFFDRGTKVGSNLRTSIVVDPPDGKTPPLTPAARAAAASRAAAQQRRPAGPQDFALPVRCILWPTAGPPMVPGPYNNNYQIVQTGDRVAIEIEMIHDVRIIPLDGRKHLSSNVRLWMGDSVGHWEGDTLVVDTTNFTDRTAFRGSSDDLHVVERFTKTDPNTVTYQFTVEAPHTWAQPWSAEVPMRKIDGPIFEYACHEGNYGMPNNLSGARAEEKKLAEKK